MDPKHPLYGAYLRFLRIDRHLTDADQLLVSFANECKHHLVANEYGQPIRMTAYPEVPPLLSLVASDAIHNMRAALDYIVFELAQLDSGSEQNGTQFIIEDIPSDPRDPSRGFKGRSKQYLKRLSPAHIDAIEALQPYKGVQWTKTLRDISNPDKHRKLTNLDTSGRSIGVMVRITPNGAFGPMVFRTPDMPEEAGFISKYDLDIDAHNTISIAPADPLKPSLMSTLRDLQTAVGQTIYAFEPEF
jgi:hypothetical protein